MHATWLRLTATLLCWFSGALAAAQPAGEPAPTRDEARPGAAASLRFAQPARSDDRLTERTAADSKPYGNGVQAVSRRSASEGPASGTGYHALTLDNAAGVLASHQTERSEPDTTGAARSDTELPTEPAAANGGPVRTRLPPRGASAALRLKSPNESAARRSPVGSLPSPLTVASSLAIVLGLFFVVMVFLRRGGSTGLQLLPREALDILGRAPLPGRQQVYLIRCGGKVLLVSVTTGGAETLTEITDPREVERLAALCHQGKPDSASATFRHVLNELGAQPHAPGFVDQPAAPPRRGMFTPRGREVSNVV